MYSSQALALVAFKIIKLHGALLRQQLQYLLTAFGASYVFIAVIRNIWYGMVYPCLVKLKAI